MISRLKKLVSSYAFVIVVYAVFAVGASVISLVSGTKTFYEGGKEYKKYNNYTIFEKSYHHFIEGKDLYVLYPDEHWDLYKYSPTFSLCFGVFALLPDWAGLNLWNLLNAFILVLAVYLLPKIPDNNKVLILFLCAIELMTSMQSQQSNALIAGLLILAFALLEKDNYFMAAFFIVFSVYIKLFGLVAFALYLFYPGKLKLAAYTAFWMVFLFLLPLVTIDWQQYKVLLLSWQHLLSTDEAVSNGYSVMGWLRSWFGFQGSNSWVVLTGVILFLVPLAKLSAYKNYRFRMLALCSVLLWIVIFNHKAESPTYIIAMTGVAIWFAGSEKNSLNLLLLICAFLLTSLSPTDLFPRYIRLEYIRPYALKALPCIVIWVKVIYDMLRLKTQNENNLRALNGNVNE